MDCWKNMRSIGTGGRMRNLELEAGRIARNEAIQRERELWLPELELQLETEENPAIRAGLAREIKRLRNLIERASLDEQGLADRRRAKTRDRVRRFRARAKT